MLSDDPFHQEEKILLGNNYEEKKNLPSKTKMILENIQIQ